MRFRLIIFLICILSLFNVCLAQSTIIDIDKNSTPFTNISEIAEEIKPITFKVSNKEYSFVSIREVIFLNNYIVLSVLENSSGDPISKVLQFDTEGNFVKQIGEKHKSYISLSYDADRKEIGVNDLNRIWFFDEKGLNSRSIESLGFNQTYFEGNYWAVELVYDQFTIDKYDLLQYSPYGESKSTVWTYHNPPKSKIGQFPSYSLVNNKMFVSNKLDNILYQLENNQVNPKFEVKSKRRLSGGIKYINDWVITSSPDQRRRASIWHFYNLKEGKNHNISVFSGSSTLKNDLLDSGLLRPFPGSLLGNVPEKTICLIETAPHTSENSYTIYLAKLK